VIQSRWRRSATFSDIKVLLGSHAHGDHMEGDAAVGAERRECGDGGGRAGARTDAAGRKPHPIDRVIHDGDTVTLGTTLVAHLTPGHSRGCTPGH
jgi:metallo-beta-lactamase class B